MNDAMGQLIGAIHWMVAIEVLVAFVGVMSIVTNVVLALEVNRLRHDMTKTNDALVSIVKTGVVVNVITALLQAANNRRKASDQENR